MVGAAKAQTPGAAAADSVWLTPLWVFLLCVAIGAASVVAGIGGSTLYVPIVRALFGFHLDFVRGASLVAGLAGSLSAAPRLMARRIVSLHLALPCALLSSLGSVTGAVLGLHLPRDVVESALGVVVLALVALVARNRGETDARHGPGPVAQALGMAGTYDDAATGEPVEWSAHRARYALPLSVGIGLLAGLFGIGAGWAYVPTFHLLMGVPLKIAAGSSNFLISLGNGAAVWVYLLKGAVLPYVAVPSVLGMMVGSRLGSRLLDRARPAVVRRVVLALLAVAGLRLLFSGAMSLMGTG